MNVLAVGFTVIACYLVVMLLWLRYDRRLRETEEARDHTTNSKEVRP